MGVMLARDLADLLRLGAGYVNRARKIARKILASLRVRLPSRAPKSNPFG